MFFFFKLETAYEMRISDWSSDVCSSDLAETQRRLPQGQLVLLDRRQHGLHIALAAAQPFFLHRREWRIQIMLRKVIVVEGLPQRQQRALDRSIAVAFGAEARDLFPGRTDDRADRKSTRLNSSH